MRSVTDKQYGGVRTAPHVCWEIPPSETFTEDQLFKPGKKKVFAATFFVAMFLCSRLTVIRAQSNGGGNLSAWPVGLYSYSQPAAATCSAVQHELLK